MMINDVIMTDGFDIPDDQSSPYKLQLPAVL